MCDTYDITETDLNPTLLYAGKGHVTHCGKPHSHDQHTEIICILSDSVAYEIDGQIYEVTAGDILIMNRGVLHRNLLADGAPPMMEFYVGFSDYHFKNMPADTIITPSGSPVIHATTQMRQELIGLCLHMAAEQSTAQAGRYFMQKAYLIQLLLLVIRQIITAPQQDPSAYPFELFHKTIVVNEIRDYLTKHYAEKISLDLIAKNMYLSSAYISRIFKDETGETPINFLIKLRLEHASELLTQPGDASIREVASLVGYDDVYYFSKLFKKYYGKSPRNFQSAAHLA